jgi:hypothetical protein
LSGSPTDRVHRGISVEDERWTLVQRILSVLSKMLNSRAGDARAPYMEILLQAKAVPGTTRASKIICYRILTPQKPDPTS